MSKTYRNNSYPLTYPADWGILAFALAVVFREKRCALNLSPLFLLKFPVVLFSGLLSVSLLQEMRTELLWNRTAQRSLMGETEEMLPEYARLHQSLGDNGRS